MIIGKLKHYVNLQSSTNAIDDYGEENKTWSTDESIFAQIQPLRGSELLEYQQINAELTHRIIIRYTSNATPAKRILFGSRIFDINVVRNIDEKNEMQELLCKEKVVV
jgi:SPP1 family predicted phage head-tail adaptor